MILDAILSPVLNIVNKFIPDVVARDAAKAALSEAIINIIAQEDRDQAAINQAEAASTSLFVAGARPAALWICVLAMGYQYLFIPIATWVLALYHVNVPPLPVLDNNLWQLLTGLLGLSGLRTLDKIKGVA